MLGSNCNVARRATVALTLAVAAVACSAGDALEPPAPRVVEDGLLTIVDNFGGSAWRGELVERVVIGSADGPPETTFGFVNGVAATDEFLFALDRQAGVIRVFDRAGAYHHDIGEPGEGPGQFARAWDLALSPSGSLFVRDVGKGRIFELSASGEFVGDLVANGARLTATADGAVWLQTRLEGGDPGQFRFGMRAYDSDGATDRLIPYPALDNEPDLLSVPRQAAEGIFLEPGGVSLREVPFGATLSRTMSPAGVVVAGVSRHYAFEMHGEDGSVRKVNMANDPVPVPSAEADWYRRFVTTAWREIVREWAWNGPEIPATKAPYRYLIPTREGGVWAIRQGPGVPIEPCNEEAASGYEFLQSRCWEQPWFADIFDDQGLHQGAVDLPPGVRFTPPPFIDAQSMLAVHEDGLGTISVRSYDLRPLQR